MMKNIKIITISLKYHILASFFYNPLLSSQTINNTKIKVLLMLLRVILNVNGLCFIYKAKYLNVNYIERAY